MSTQQKIKKEGNELIFKFQKQDVNKKLAKLLGKRFQKYRQDFEKTQNFLKTKFLPDFPLTLSLELVNRCNLNCIMCYQEHRAAPKAELSLEVLQKIANECKKNGLPSLILGLGAETLVYENIKKVLPILKKAEIMDIFFGTNGVLLTKEISDLLIKNKISRIEISLDAATPETYKKVRGFDMLSKIKKNIEELIALKKKHKSLLPIIRLCFVVMDINAKEAQQFINKWQNKVDYIDFQRCVDFSHINRPAKIDQKVIANSFCSYPFYSLNIWADGSVSPCCSFYGEKLKFGNIYKDKLKDIWGGKKMQKIRKQIVSKKFNFICQKCLYFRDRDLIDKSFKN